MSRRGATGGGMCPSSGCAKEEGSEGGWQYGVMCRVMEGGSGNSGCCFPVGRWPNSRAPRGKPSFCSLLFAALGGLLE